MAEVPVTDDLQRLVLFVCLGHKMVQVLGPLLADEVKIFSRQNHVTPYVLDVNLGFIKD